MAFTPDRAIEDMEEVGQKAFLLYVFYCKFGSMKNNVVFVGLERCAEFLGVVYENACRTNAVLKRKGWIATKNGKTILLKGFEHLAETDENNSFDANENSKTDENNSSDAANKPKLTKTTVSGNEKTDENNSFESEKDLPEKSKTDENNSFKLTKTTVSLYKDEPAHFNQPKEEEKKKNISQSLPKTVKVKNFTESEKARRLFEFWKTKMNSKRSIFTEKREKAVKTVMKKISYSDCLRAINGCTKNDWNMGKHTDNKTLYNEFERIFKSLENTEKFRGYYFADMTTRQLKKGGKTNAAATKSSDYGTDTHLKPRGIGRV